MNTYKQGAILYTLRSHITNMIKGVTSGFRYKMHEVHKHFPIDLQVKDNAVNIIKYLGQRDVKVIPLLSLVRKTQKILANCGLMESTVIYWGALVLRFSNLAILKIKI